MAGKNRLMNQIIDGSEMGSSPVLGLPIVEIAGNRRVLIENHLGVNEYGEKKITVRVKHGYIEICGEHLQLQKLTKEQLVISGKICSLTLIQRDKNEC